MRRINAVFAFILTLFCCPIVLAQDYNVVQNSGPSSNRVDMVFVGDGYTATDISNGIYATHVNAMVDYMFNSSPDAYFFGRYRNFFNIVRVNVVSAESGADKPLEPGGAIYKNTALDASYWKDGVTERYLAINNVKGLSRASAALSSTGYDREIRLATVNDTKYGGSGGIWATYAGGNSQATEIALHEIGHTFAKLGDQYGDYNPAVVSTFTGTEASISNLADITTNPSYKKWDRWLGYNDPHFIGTSLDMGPIGYYEEAYTYDLGAYRPSLNSKMRTLGRPIDAVGREAYLKSIYDYTNPLDSYTSNLTTLNNPSTLSATPIDPSVIGLHWSLNGSLIGTGSTLDISSLGLTAGNYTIDLRAYDTVLDHAFTGDSLDFWRQDSSPLEQNVSWNITVVPEPSTLFLFSFSILLIQRRRLTS